MQTVKSLSKIIIALFIIIGAVFTLHQSVSPAIDIFQNAAAFVDGSYIVNSPNNFLTVAFLAYSVIVTIAVYLLH